MNQPQLQTYPPGTTLTVGSHTVRIINYLTSGGFAQVYQAEISPPDSYTNLTTACLKRVVVPDKTNLNVLRAEVDAMKVLSFNRHIVSHIDSHAAKASFSQGSYEVFMLMEYCQHGGLIDFMNTRLQHRLQEFEILDIVSQISQGVAAMHAQQPPLLHRDLKIENVLIAGIGEYKLCDFGSVSGIIRPPKNQQELTFVQNDILKNTTAQYRSPEMIDLYSGLPIDEKSDIWALGVFLYKLCYYTTPFENTGEEAILNVSYQFPSYPSYSEGLKNLIRSILVRDPAFRPNICEIITTISALQGIPCPITDFYQMRKHMPIQQSNNLIDINNSTLNETTPMLNNNTLLTPQNIPLLSGTNSVPGHIPIEPSIQFSAPLISAASTSNMVNLNPFSENEKSYQLNPSSAPLNIPTDSQSFSKIKNNALELPISRKTMPHLRTIQPLSSNVSDFKDTKDIKSNRINDMSSLKDQIDSEAKTFRQNKLNNISMEKHTDQPLYVSTEDFSSSEDEYPLEHAIDKSPLQERPPTLEHLQKQHSTPSPIPTHSNLKKVQTASDIPASNTAILSHKLKHLSLPENTLVELQDGNDSWTSLDNKNTGSSQKNSEDLMNEINRENEIKLKNKMVKSSLQKRMMDKLSSSEESIRARGRINNLQKLKDEKIENEKLRNTSSKERIKNITLSSTSSSTSSTNGSNNSTKKIHKNPKDSEDLISKESKSTKKKPLPPPKPAHLRPKVPHKPAILSERKIRQN